MRRAVMTARAAAGILFGPQFFEPGFDPQTAQFASGADVCEWLAEHFGFTDVDYAELHRKQLEIEAS